MTAAILDPCRHVGYRELDDPVARDHLQLCRPGDAEFGTTRRPTESMAIFMPKNYQRTKSQRPG